ncbi:hypothetical protein GCM10023185_41290 [Hymenobacter saemangeumensis]|uniref:Cytochrome c domain-containing protein n=1 Tax=Hymenobacter saemangeumensis TaxID=1084522 RepID=A0ABP8IRB3_9BACT
MTRFPYPIARRATAYLAGLLLLASACTYSHGGDAVVPCEANPATISFAATVAPIIRVNCRDGCHNATTRGGGVNFDDFGDTQFYAGSGSIVRRIELDPSHPDFMPKGRGKLSACDIARIKAWVAAGTPNN